MPHTESVLLAAIVAAPEDDLPRLAYADHLEEVGQAERAEFIRLEVELAKEQAADDREQIRQRAVELLKRHGKTWFPLLERVVSREYVTDRGFPNEVFLDARKFIVHGEAIFHANPTLRELVICRLGRNMPGLASCSALEQVRALSFFETPLRAQEMEELAASPHLRNLRCFEIPHTDTRIGPRGARALANARSITRLTTLNLDSQAIHDSGAGDICCASWAAGLEVLELGNNGLSDDTPRTLQRGARLNSLHTLDLSRNHLTPAGIRTLTTGVRLEGLKSLSLGNNLVLDAGVRSLVESACFGRLSHLNLWAGGLSDLGCAIVCRAASALQALDLSVSGAGPETFLALRATPPGRLQDLNLSGCHIGPEQAVLLGQVGPLPELRNLHLGRNPLGPAGIRALLNGPLITTVTDLDLDQCKLGDEGAEMLAGSKIPAGFRFLRLTENGITKRGKKALLERFGGAAWI
jgi:uncharacterized protein (TIGR02996 family)